MQNVSLYLDEVAVSAEAARRRAVLAVIIGNGFEWFDFISYSFFAIIIAKLFFPVGDPNVSLLLSVSTVGVGFFMRPVGGLVLGALADKAGRKVALTITIALMTAGTALIGFAPTYKQAGLLAPAVIVLARLLQGFSAGGEMGGATAYLVDRVPGQRRGYYTSWIQASIGFAIILSAALGTSIVHFLSPEQIDSWGWRLPFLFGLLLGPVGLYIRTSLVESDSLDRSSRESAPVRDILRHGSLRVLIGFGLVVFWTVCSYVLLFYIPTYAVKALKLASSTGFIAVLVGATIVLVATPVFGHLSDRFGRKPFMIGALVAAIALAYPLFGYVNRNPGLESLIVFQLFFGFVIACYEGPILAAISELFPARVQSTGISIAYNLAVITFGGFSATIITWAIAATHNNLAPAVYVIVTASLSLLAAIAWRPVQDSEARR